MNTLLVSIVAGLALALGMVAIYGLMKDLGTADTTYRDRPPPGFRLAWPLVNVMGNTFGELLGEERLKQITQRLNQGGQSYALTPQQFFGGKIVDIFVERFAGSDLVLDAIETRHHHGSESEVRIA